MLNLFSKSPSFFNSFNSIRSNTFCLHYLTKSAILTWLFMREKSSNTDKDLEGTRVVLSTNAKRPQLFRVLECHHGNVAR